MRRETRAHAATGSAAADAPGETGTARGMGRPLCPSARPETEGSRIFGVVVGSVAAPFVRMLDDPVPAPPDLDARLGGIAATEVMRFAAPCACNRCRHFNGGVCGIGRRMVEELAPVTDGLPTCAIRPECRWWRQEGRAACLRCRQVVTDSYDPGGPAARVIGTAG
jgi:hypothetical protein